MWYRLLDNDNDIMQVSGSDKWDSFEDCKKDVIKAFKEGELSINYLPWRFLEAEEFDENNNTVIYAEITNIYISLDTNILRTVAEVAHG